jgi:hypothetical protein
METAVRDILSRGQSPSLILNAPFTRGCRGRARHEITVLPGLVWLPEVTPEQVDSFRAESSLRVIGFESKVFAAEIHTDYYRFPETLLVGSSGHPMGACASLK